MSVKSTLLLLLAFLAAGSFAQSPAANFLTKGDESFNAFDNEQALKNFQLAFKADSSNCEVIWKLSRTHINIGEVAEKDPQRYHYYEAERLARKAVELCPNSADTHLTLAIAVGRVALMEGGKKKVELSKEVKAEAEKTLEIDSQQDIAHHVLGRWNREVSNLSGILKMFAKILYGGLPPASLETAVEHFEQAIAINPNYINHHLELGLTYESTKQWDKARAEYAKIPNLPKMVYNDPEHKKEAADRLLKISDKK